MDDLRCVVALMDSTVLVSTGGPASRDIYGAETWSTGVGVAHRARVSEGWRRSRMAQTAESAPTDITVWMASTVAHSTHHRLTLPDGTRPMTMAVDTYTLPSAGVVAERWTVRR